MTPPPEGAGDGAGRPPDLLFCRSCGRSIARREFLAARALLLEGRAYCGECAPGALRLRRAVRVILGVSGAVAVLLLGAAVFGVGEGVRQVRERAEEAAAAREGTAERARRLEARVEALAAEVRGLAGVVEAAGRGLEVARREGSDAWECVEDRLEGVERSLAVVLEAVDALRADLAALQGPDRLSPAEEREVAARLDDANPGIRYSALVALRRGTGDAARAAAVRGLSDSQDSVRYEAANLARLLGARDAIPGLVALLDDGTAAVREAAIEALRSLEGEDLGYDPLDPPDERAEAMARWRERIEGK